MNGMSRAKRYHQVSQWIADGPLPRETLLPLDFSSAVHSLSSSCISSGSTSFLDHASSHLGFGGGAGASSGRLDCFLDFVFALTAPPSLLLNTFEKNGILVPTRGWIVIRGLIECVGHWFCSAPDLTFSGAPARLDNV